MQDGFLFSLHYRLATKVPRLLLQQYNQYPYIKKYCSPLSKSKLYKNTQTRIRLIMDAAITTLRTLVGSASQTAREEVLNSLNNLIISLEKPIDVLNRLSDAQLPIAIVKSSIDAGIFNALAQNQQALSAEQLASHTGVAPLLTGL